MAQLAANIATLTRSRCTGESDLSLEHGVLWATASCCDAIRFTRQLRCLVFFRSAREVVGLAFDVARGSGFGNFE